MKRRALLVSLFFALLSVPAWAQFSGPTMGYIFDTSSSTIRPVRGIPGASLMGQAIPLDVKVRNAVFSADNNYAIAATDAGEVMIIRGLSGTPTTFVVPEIRTDGQVLALSPDGLYAAVYNSEQGRVQVIGGLPLNPALSNEVDVTSLGQALTALAVNRAGMVMAAFSDGTSGNLYSFAGASIRMITAVGSVSAIRFEAAGDDAALVDRRLNQVSLIQNSSTAATPILIAKADDGISDPTGLFLSRDGKGAYVANSGAGTITLISLGGGASRSVSCNCELTKLQDFQNDSVFAITDNTAQPIVVFDGSLAESRFFLVPPEQPSN
jgi:DNA-binding beta-propeller fold protein YncE